MGSTVVVGLVLDEDLSQNVRDKSHLSQKKLCRRSETSTNDPQIEKNVVENSMQAQEMQGMGVEPQRAG